ncbi:MAG: glutathione S-transferase family protein [Thalassobaculaceae bacterium]
MELFYTANSPYGRKVRVYLREAGLAPRVTETLAVTRRADSPLLAHGPTGRVPALLLDDGALILEAALICRFLEEGFGPTGVQPTTPAAARDDLVLEGVATTLLDSLSLRAREFLYRRPDERSARALAYETARSHRCYGALATTLTVAPPVDTRLSLGQITAAAALATADQALLAEPWRADQPELAAWYDEVATRPSLADTFYPGWPTQSPAQSPAQSKDGAPA